MEAQDDIVHRATNISDYFIGFNFIDGFIQVDDVYEANAIIDTTYKFIAKT